MDRSCRDVTSMFVPQSQDEGDEGSRRSGQSPIGRMMGGDGGGDRQSCAAWGSLPGKCGG